MATPTPSDLPPYSDLIYPVTCPTCCGNRWVPSLRITGAVHDALLATIGGPECEVSKGSICRYDSQARRAP